MLIGSLTKQMNETIANTKLKMRSPSGDTTDIHIQIGRPYEISEDEAACPIEMKDLYQKIPDLRGIDTFQALAIAFMFVRTTIREWTKKGYIFELPDGDVIPEKMWFWFEEIEINANQKIDRTGEPPVRSS